MLDERITPNIWLSELVRSGMALRRGIDNTPPPAVLQVLRGTLAPGLQRVRDLLCVPVQITSGYRSPALNAAVGSGPKSQHLLGLAADFIAPQFGTPRAVCRYLVKRAPDVRFDQLIWEGQWVHISFAGTAPARGEVLTAHFQADGRVTYSKGLA